MAEVREALVGVSAALAFALLSPRRYTTPPMFHEFLHTWLGWVENWGYPGVVILMAMESSIFPVPSEVVIPPAAILAASTGKMSLLGVVIAGTFGSWLGSAITYWVALAVGRPVVEKWGRYFFIPPEKLERAERFMHRYEAGGLFFARLLPVLRHLISIPAGIIRMGFLKFSALTIVGAAIWCTVLAWLGGKVGGELRAAGKNPLDPEELVKAVKHESHWIIGAVLLLSQLYVLAMWITAPQQEISPHKVLFSFKGRIGRGSFWTVIYLMPLFIGIAALPFELLRNFGSGLGTMGLIMSCLGWFFCSWISLAVQAKRWHDLNKSEWMVLINLIPILGGLFSIGALGFVRGTQGPNRFGDGAFQKIQEDAQQAPN